MTAAVHVLLLTLGLAASLAHAESDLDQLAALLAGKFDTHAIQPELAVAERLVDKRVRISAPQLGKYVFYQQINHRQNLEVYRQRLLVLSVASNSGDIVQHAYALNEPEWYVDADAAVFENIDMDDLDAFMPSGCEQVWTRTAEGFAGYVDPERCEIISSRTGKPRRIESESKLTNETLRLAERGYDADTGEQLFGTAQGESLLLVRIVD